MVKGGWKRQEASEEGESEFRFVHTNADLEDILQTTSLRQEVLAQRMRYYMQTRQQVTDEADDVCRVQKAICTRSPEEACK